MTNEERDSITEALKAEFPIEEQVAFSEIDFQEKIKDNAFQIIKYRELYYRELSIFEQLETKMDKLLGIQYKKYRFEDEREYNKVEIEKYCLPSDPKVLRMKDIMARQQIRVRFFDMCMKALERQQWNMKTFQDSLRSGI